MALTIYLNKKDIKLQSSIIYRDILFYIIATLLVIGFAFYGELSLYSAFSMLGLYIVYVIVTYFQERDNDGHETEDDPKKSHALIEE